MALGSRPHAIMAPVGCNVANFRFSRAKRGAIVPAGTHGGWSVELFRAEKVGELESISTKKCRACGERLVLVRGILDASTGEMIQMFECDCGERIWEN